MLSSILAVVAPLTVLQAQASTSEHKRPTHVAPIHHAYVSREAVRHTRVQQVVFREAVRGTEGHPTEATHHVVVHHAIARRFEPAHRRVVRGGGISCVPFARNDSGIQLTGNAWQWWGHAAGVYARGSVPELGSVLAFRSNPQMRLGHVAVVSRVINRREITIDQANWWSRAMRGAVSRDVPVVDVSEANDWTAVRVGLRDGEKFGSVYPTYGFIYDRPDDGAMVAAVGAPAPQPRLNPAPSDLRPAVERPWATYEEVAEAPDAPPRRIRIDTAAGSGGMIGAIDRK